MRSDTAKAEGVKGSELCFGPACAIARAVKGRRRGSCIGSLFGGWLRGQRPHSQDGSLPSREGLDTEGCRLPGPCAGPNIATVEPRKPRSLCSHLMHTMSLGLLNLGLQGIITVLFVA